MPRNYQRTDVKRPENKYAIADRAFVLDSHLSDFQRLAYTIQLGEYSLGYSNGEIKVWVDSVSKYSNYKIDVEHFLSSLLDNNIAIDFQSNPHSNGLRQTALFEEEPAYSFISMFSGGLDSGSLAAQYLRENRKGVLHHTITHNIPYGKAKKLYDDHFSQSGNFVLLATRGENKIDNPMYLRTRGLIFVNNILCIASQLKIKEVIVPENGPFMINLPVSPNSEPTRTTNPLMLKEWTEIFNKITNSNVHVVMPYIDLTKSEVIIMGGKKNLIKETWSCSYFQGLSKMCGMCNSCLVRILSCYAIDEGEDLRSDYKDNPFTTESGKMKNSNRNSYRVSIDAAGFWFHIIHPEKTRNEIEREKFEAINKIYPVMRKHALDMFLGFGNLKIKYKSKEPLFISFDNVLKQIDSRELKNRSKELVKRKELVGWI